MTYSRLDTAKKGDAVRVDSSLSMYSDENGKTFRVFKPTDTLDMQMILIDDDNVIKLVNKKYCSLVK